MDSAHGFLHKKFTLLLLGFWYSVSLYLLPLFRRLTRFLMNGFFSKSTSGNCEVVLEESNEERLKVTEPYTAEEVEEKQDFLGFPYLDKNEVGEIMEEEEEEEEAAQFSFTFRFPTFEEFSKSNRDFSHLLNVDEPSSSATPITACSSKSEGLDESDGESYEASEVKPDPNGGILSEQDQKQDDFEGEDVPEEEKLGNSDEKMAGEVLETEEIDAFMEAKVENFCRESVSSSSLDSDGESISSNYHRSAMSQLADSYAAGGFLSDGDFEAEFDEKEDEVDWTESNFLSEKDFGGKLSDGGETGGKNMDFPEKNLSKDTSNKLESLWEHQELIEQLKMEIKKVRAIGLPTIFEESESPPKIMEELQPWKIEEVYQRGGGDKMGEVHKFYKSYRERMRKFDIFNYQKMYAIGFLQLKDPPQSFGSSKSSLPEITTLLSQSFSTTKGKKLENNPTTKFIKELQSDLEVVYVGQMCLSWEILHWQYEKLLDLWESDPRGLHRFNEVAGEFQQFQVLTQRFIEDEPFQGPRVQNYVKNRCVFRNLLQVPLIREDSSKMRRKARKEGGGYEISSDMLVEIVEESIRIFWRFVRADKVRRHQPVEFQKPEDSLLFTEVQRELHKKERKLKEQLRSGNCILRKLRSCREEDDADDQVLYFFSQVDMKLVARVLRMSGLTSDQLIWCRNKLSKVRFVNRKIHVEPSFLLFPC